MWNRPQRPTSLVLALAAATLCFSASATAQSLAIVEAPVPLLLVDKNGNASITVTLRNAGAAVPLQLTLSNFSQTLPNGNTYPLPVTATFTGAGGTLPVPPAALGMGAAVGLKITVSGLQDSGAATGQLLNSGVKVADLRALRTPSSYNVQIDGGNEITFASDLHTSLTLKNGDSMNYGFMWSLEPDGLRAAGAGGPLYLPASSSATISLDGARPEAGFFSAGFLKDQLTNGVLVLTPQLPPGSPMPPAIRLPVKIHTHRWPGYGQAISEFFWTALLLAAGGVASLLFRYFIPNALGAIALEKKMRDMEQRLHGAGLTFPVRYRVLLEAKLAGCRARLRDIPKFFPAFATLLSTVQADSAVFNQWLDIAYSVGTLLDTAQMLLQTGVPPTVLDLLELKCDEALAPIESEFTKPEEVTAMQAALAVASGYIKALKAGTSIPELEAAIKSREARVQPQVAALVAAFPAFGPLLTKAAGNAGTPFVTDQYIARDIISRQAELLCDYRDLAMKRGAAAIPPPAAPAGTENALTRMMALDTKFRDSVMPESRESLREARLFFEEMRQDFYPRALLAETGKTPPALDVLFPRQSLLPATPVRFSLRFQRQPLNDTPAVREWTVKWDFGDGTDAATGWDVWHSFAQAGNYTVSLSLKDIDGNAIAPAAPVAITQAISVSGPAAGPGRRFYKPWTWTQEAKVEALQLIFVLGIALSALYATARGKVETLDVPTAVLTVFGIGFAADTLKNLLTQKPGQQ